VRGKGPPRTRQYRVERPRAENARRASSWRTFGLRTRMELVFIAGVAPPRLLSEINPKPDHRGQQQKAKHDVDAMLHGSFLRGLAQRRTAYRDRLDFVVHGGRSEEHTSELQSQSNLVCRLLLEKKKEDVS